MDWVLVLQACLYAFAGIFGLLVAVPMGVLKKDFDGQCILYGNLYGTTLMAGPDSNCNYVLFLQVVAGAMLSAGLLVLHVFAVLMRIKGNPLKTLKSFQVLLGLLVAHATVGFLVFVAACIVTTGYNDLCRSIEHNHEGMACKGAENFEDPFRDWSDFYEHLWIAMIGCWLSLGCWIVLTGLSTYKMVKNRREAMKRGPKRLYAPAAGAPGPGGYPEPGVYPGAYRDPSLSASQTSMGYGQYPVKAGPPAGQFAF